VGNGGGGRRRQRERCGGGGGGGGGKDQLMGLNHHSRFGHTRAAPSYGQTHALLSNKAQGLCAGVPY